MPILTWEHFVYRRKVNVPEWLAFNEVEDYEGLCALLEKLDIWAPKEHEVGHYFQPEPEPEPEPEPVKERALHPEDTVPSVETPAVKPPVAKPPAAKPAKKAPAKKKTTRRTRTKRSGGKGV